LSRVYPLGAAVSSTEDRIFEALGHKLRRSIIEYLGRAGSSSYSELMKALGVEDSGTFAFHVKKLVELGIIEKDESGNYRLTDLGAKAYEIIRGLKEEAKAVEAVKEAVAERREEAKAGIVEFSDLVKFTLTRRLAETVAAAGRKILVGNVTVLEIEEMPRELFEKAVESIEDVKVVRAPPDLLDLAMLKSKRVSTVKSSRGEAVAFRGRRGVVEASIGLAEKMASLGPRIASAIVTAITSALPSIISVEFPEVYDRTRVFTAATSIPPNVRSARIDVDSSILRVTASDKPMLLLTKDRDRCEHSVEIRDERLAEVELDVCRAELRLPAQLENVKMKLDSSSSKVFGLEVNELSVDLDSSMLGLDGVKVSSRLELVADSSTLNGTVRMGCSERCTASISLDSSVANLEIEVPRDIAVEVKVESEVSDVDVEVDGTKIRGSGVYREPEFEKASRRLHISIYADSSAARVKLKKT